MFDVKVVHCSTFFSGGFCRVSRNGGGGGMGDALLAFVVDRASSKF